MGMYKFEYITKNNDIRIHSLKQLYWLIMIRKVYFIFFIYHFTYLSEIKIDNIFIFKIQLYVVTAMSKYIS